MVKLYVTSTQPVPDTDVTWQEYVPASVAELKLLNVSVFVVLSIVVGAVDLYHLYSKLPKSGIDKEPALPSHKLDGVMCGSGNVVVEKIP
jgi:hypothetical protein